MDWCWLYIGGVFVTAWLHHAMIMGPVTRPLNVIWTALLWPIFLPVFIGLAVQSFRGR